MESKSTVTNQSRIERLLDFQAALAAGTGITRGDDPRGRKSDEQLKAGEFDNAGLGDVARSLMENIRRLIAHSSMPMGVFSYGRAFECRLLQRAARTDHRGSGRPAFPQRAQYRPGPPAVRTRDQASMIL